MKARGISTTTATTATTATTRKRFDKKKGKEEEEEPEGGSVKSRAEFKNATVFCFVFFIFHVLSSSTTTATGAFRGRRAFVASPINQRPFF